MCTEFWVDKSVGLIRERLKVLGPSKPECDGTIVQRTTTWRGFGVPNMFHTPDVP